MEENHYYPYGMLINGLSSNNSSIANPFKFNSDRYEVSCNENYYSTPFRTYDPVIARWYQLDPVQEFSNGYFAYGGDPVLYSDPSGLKTVHGGAGGGMAGDNVSYGSREACEFKNIHRGGGGGDYLAAWHDAFDEMQTWRQFKNLPEDVQNVLTNLLTYEQIINISNLDLWRAEIEEGGICKTVDVDYQLQFRDYAGSLWFDLDWNLKSSSLNAQGNGGKDFRSGLNDAGNYLGFVVGAAEYNLGKVIADRAKYSFTQAPYETRIPIKGNTTIRTPVGNLSVNASKLANGLKWGGRALGAFGLGVTAVQAYNGDISYGEAALDATFGVVGFFGPVGFIVSSTYFFVAKPLYNYATKP